VHSYSSLRDKTKTRQKKQQQPQQKGDEEGNIIFHQSPSLEKNKKGKRGKKNGTKKLLSASKVQVFITGGPAAGTVATRNK